MKDNPPCLTCTPETGRSVHCNETCKGYKESCARRVDEREKNSEKLKLDEIQIDRVRRRKNWNRRIK